MTIEQYLRGKVSYELSSDNIASILYERGIAEGALLASVAERQRELALADVYMFLVNSSTTSSGGSDSDGGWSHTEPCRNISKDVRSRLLLLAKDLYAKWDETVPTSTVKVTSTPLY